MRSEGVVPNPPNLLRLGPEQRHRAARYVALMTEGDPVARVEYLVQLGLVEPAESPRTGYVPTEDQYGIRWRTHDRA